MKDVAATAGVSVATVSNVLNRPEVVAPATRRRVEAAIKKLGFVRSEPARHLRSGLAHSVGLVVPDIANPFFAAVSRGVADIALQHGYSIVLVDAAEDVEREAVGIELLLRQQVRGALITPIDEEAAVLELLLQRSVPTTLLDRQSPNGEHCSVAVDHERGGALGIEYLARLRHRHIAWVRGPNTIPQVHDRSRGVERAARRAGVRVVDVEVATMTTTAGEEAGRRILALTERPTAVFCANDLLALGTIRVLTAAGVRIGEDVSIVGYDDIDFCKNASTPLTSIRQPADAIGANAMRLLLSECEDVDAHTHQRVLFDPMIVERASSRPAL
jgi:LacI family transcriptional regulator